MTERLDWMDAWTLAFMYDDPDLRHEFAGGRDGLHIQVRRREFSLERIVSWTEMEQTLIPKEEFTATVASQMINEITEASS